MKYHILNRVYENIATGVRSEFLADALEGLETVTINRGFVCPIPGSSGFWKTDPFLEVRTVNPETLNRPRGVNPQRTGLLGLIDAICDAISAVWSADGLHVVFHSSGYDSRMLSSCIRKLYRDGRISGDVLFLSNRWEAREFTRIMQLQGWKPDQYLVCAPGQEGEHFGRVLDFKHYWHINNAPIPQLGNVLANMAEWAKREGIITGEAQFFNGHGPEIGADREGAWNIHNNAENTAKVIWANATRYYYWGGMSNCPGNTHANFVLAEQEVINAALGYDYGGSKREAVVDTLCPEIKHIPRLGISDNNHSVSASVRRRAESDYADCYYARLTKSAWSAPKISTYDSRWATWGLASLVEHLHEQGVEIKL